MTTLEFVLAMLVVASIWLLGPLVTVAAVFVWLAVYATWLFIRHWLVPVLHAYWDVYVKER